MTTLKVKNKEELQRIINLEVAEHGYECDLNHLDISNVTDMNHLFYYHSFNGDISRWDVSKVTNMRRMFEYAEFTGDVASWVLSRDCNATQVFNKYHESPLGLLAYLTKERPLPRSFRNNPEYQRALKLTQSLNLNEFQAAHYIYQHLFKPKMNHQEMTFNDFSL